MLNRALVATGILCLTGAPLVAVVRPPAVAGTFYPKDPQELRATVAGFLKNVPEQRVTGTPVAILVPHAGYAYSAQTAAYAYRLLDKKAVHTVILIGNSHHMPLARGAVYAHGAFETPLGTVPVDTALAQKILRYAPVLEENEKAHAPEHALEVQLPFLQAALADFKIVPILLGGCSPAECRTAGEAIARAIKESHAAGSTLIIASSDLSHYPSWATANMTDSAALKHLERFDPDDLDKFISATMASPAPNLVCVFCGKEALYTAMYAAKTLGADTARTLNYSNSGSVTGEREKVVGYGAAVFYRAARAGKEKAMNEFSISDKNQKELLKIARRSVEEYVKNGTMPSLKTSDPELTQDAAVFVTLTEGGNLRGCIGTTMPQGPLYQAVARMAVAAATEDTRFHPVTAGELKDIRFEISVLSPMVPVHCVDDIKQNHHGVLVQRGRRCGLFLPQVWEHFKTKEDFLCELCWQKAGLEPNAWQDPDTDMSVFTVFAFEE